MIFGQMRLLRSQKIDVIGRLAGSVAHGINDLLTIIKWRCALDLLNYQQEDQMKKILRRLATHRIVRLISLVSYQV
ncbi:MAG TPA: hypothetical protein PKV48_06635 [Thermodesulfobacteriota bacterium]|nr:hypothetical protein [Thermodesulfobacteriota bacterium]